MLTLTTIPGIIRQAKDAVPLAIKTWKKATDTREREAGLRLILFMEGKRIFDPNAFEVPYACYKSVENITSKVEEERSNLTKDPFRSSLLELIKIGNRFKTSLDKMNLSENKQWEGQLEEPERLAFREALLRFQFEMGVQVAAMSEVWRVEVPSSLIPQGFMGSLFPGLRTRD